MGKQSFKQSFKRRSYNLNNKNEDAENKKDKRLGMFCFNNFAFEPELKQFVLEGWNGEKKRSVNYRAGWNIDEHRIPLNELIARYGTNIETGLSDDLAGINRQKFGTNILQPPKKRSEILKLVDNVLLGLNLLLWICGVISLVAAIIQFLTDDFDDAYGSLYSGASLLVVVLVAGLFSYYQEFQSSKIMEAFKKMIPQHVIVLRNDQRKLLDSTEIVVGDIIEIKYGDKIPCDVRLIECHSFKVDNSSITGESEPQKRSSECTHKDPMESKNVAFFSTNAVEGNAKGIVIKVGHGTLIGRLASLASSVATTKSPIAKEMTYIITIMTIISLSFGVIFYVIAITMNYSYLSALFFVIGIVVGNIPENLNVTLTIILSLAAKKMAKKNCLVKNLHAVETLGSCSVICSDKTGTLTQNKMSVAHLWFNGNDFEADTTENANDSESRESYYSKSDVGFLELAKVASLCSRARFKPGEEDKPPIMRTAEGDSSEVAILKCMEMQFGNVERYREKFPKVFEIPFNSVNKFQLSVHAVNDRSDSCFFVAMKGAPEKLKEMCKSILIENEALNMDPLNKILIQDAYLKLASLGERVLGFCDCYLPADKFPNDYVFTEENFTALIEDLRFVGLISLIDPPRSVVPSAVLKCKSAGVKVVMITGDHPVTAKAIARSVNIISPENKTIEDIYNEMGTTNMEEIQDSKLNSVNAAVISGADISVMSTEQLQCFISMYEDIVFARCSPVQKYDIVKAYQKLGHVVAVTGDGVNDSPALKRADVGIAMGSGTDVAKEVADMIILDDNFASIVAGIEDGRLIFDNLKKLLRYTMADNVAEMYCYWIYIILRVPLPMGTIAMLLSTLGADVFPAVSLAHESVESDIMKLKPRDPADRLMSMPMLSYSYGQVAVIETLSGFLAYFVTFACYGWFPQDLIFNQRRYESKYINDLCDSFNQEWTYESRMDLEKLAQTSFFLALVICQFFNAICCKTRRISVFQKGFQNNLMNVGLVLMILVPCIFIYTPSLNTVVSFAPLGVESWLAALPFGIFLFVYDECRRLVLRSGPSKWISTEFRA